MDPIENIINHVALLFWFVNERNWTIQSTSTIVKPRKDGDEYKPGEIVIARYSGKKYYAVIISVNDVYYNINKSMLILLETGVAAAANASLESQTDGQVELVLGYGVMVSVPQIDACLRKAKTSGTALARLLGMVLFDDETLANSCARGTKTKPALDRRKVDAIIKYVGEKRSMSEPEVVQAINQKCSDIRRSRTVKPILAKK